MITDDVLRQILIDHGLCIKLSEKFRYDYSLLWRSLFVGDVATIERIGTSWGIAANNSDMLASVRSHAVVPFFVELTRCYNRPRCYDHIDCESNERSPLPLRRRLTSNRPD